jgi:cytochrome c peroxidase
MKHSFTESAMKADIDVAVPHGCIVTSLGQAFGLIFIAVVLPFTPSTNAADTPPAAGSQRLNFRDASGVISTVPINGPIDRQNAFFQDLGANGRSCATCHQPADAWSITPRQIRARFDRSGGRDPLFRPNDGATCPDADVSNPRARHSAYMLLLNKGLIRVGLPVPVDAEFTVVSIDDPHRCSTPLELSLYRRPLPSANLRFLSAVMWDGRETVQSQTLLNDLKTQARNATLGHAQARFAPTDEQLDQIVAFEIGLFTAQSRDKNAGLLRAGGGKGGPMALGRQTFFIGINDPLGGNPSGEPFDPEAFTLFASWKNIDGLDPQSRARQAIARGETLFNTKPIQISGVAGLNDNLGMPVISGTCTTCHDSPNVGNHSVIAPLNIGVSDAAQRTPDLPLFSLRCKTTGAVIQTTDPGRAMISGKCADIGKFKGPVLRGLAARPPYFHNGSAASLRAVVKFYDERFGIGLRDREKADLLAFLRAL